MTDAPHSLIGERLKQAQAVLGGLAGDNLDVTPYLKHLFDSPGKLVRPTVNLLAGQMFGFGKASAVEVANLAAAIEALHIATLVHDDIVDDAQMRRNQPTLSALWGSKIALLVGDYLFASALELTCTSGSSAIVSSTAQTVKRLSEGELRENLASRNTDKSQDEYLEIVRAKTASLFAYAAECGGLLGGASENEVATLRRYGENLGVAFQIKDDLLDFELSQKDAHKPTMHDLQAGVVTLPLILALRSGLKHAVLKNYFKTGAPHDLMDIKRTVIQTGALQACHDLARDYCSAARSDLSGLRACPTRDALDSLVDTVYRN